MHASVHGHGSGKQKFTRVSHSFAALESIYARTGDTTARELVNSDWRKNLPKKIYDIQWV